MLITIGMLEVREGDFSVLSTSRFCLLYVLAFELDGVE